MTDREGPDRQPETAYQPPVPEVPPVDAQDPLQGIGEAPAPAPAPENVPTTSSPDAPIATDTPDSPVEPNTTADDAPPAETQPEPEDIAAVLKEDQEPATELQKAELLAKKTIYTTLHEVFGFKKGELATLRQQLSQNGDELTNLIEFFQQLYPGAVYDAQLGVVATPDGTVSVDGAGEAEETATAETDAGDESATDEEEAAAPPPESDQEAVEVQGEVTPETEETGNTARYLEMKYRQQAFDVFQKEQLPQLLETHPQLKDKYPPGTRYDQLVAEDQAIVDAEFRRFFSEDFLPKVSREQFTEDHKSFLAKLKASGMEMYVKGSDSSSMITFMRALLLSDGYASGVTGEAFAHSPEDNGKHILDVSHFKEMCNWSTDDEQRDDNRRKWMLLCALIYRRLQGDGAQLNPVEWTSEAALTDEQIKKHMEELHEACLKAGKVGVHEAMKTAFDPENGNAEFEKKSYLDDAVPSADLIVHFQMLANHSDYLQNFFSS